MFTILIVPFAIAAMGARADIVVGLAIVFAMGFPIAGLLLLLAKPLNRFGQLGARVKRQRRPWRAAAGTAYSFATGAALRMAEPDWSRAHVVAFAVLGGIVMFAVFGLIGRFVGDPPTEPGPTDDRPTRCRPTS